MESSGYSFPGKVAGAGLLLLFVMRRLPTIGHNLVNRCCCFFRWQVASAMRYQCSIIEWSCFFLAPGLSKGVFQGQARTFCGVTAS